MNPDPGGPFPSLWTLCVRAHEKIGVPAAARATMASRSMPGTVPVLLEWFSWTHRLRPARSKARDWLSESFVTTS